jgi:hypothetical protein
MGLDMYLTARRYLRDWGQNNDIETINMINKMFNFDPIEKNSIDCNVGIEELVFGAAYWRKANAIHGWFVKKVQEGVDECKDTPVSREQLQELIDTCKAVLADNSKASELLPSQSGFFFGSTDYNEWYFNDLAYTVEQLERVLSTEVFKKCDFYYRSSW